MQQQPLPQLGFDGLWLARWSWARLTDTGLIMSEIKTLVYFDIEATGLKSSGRPRICEISLVAVNTHDLVISKSENKQYCEVNFLPRIVNKLTLCVYPMAVVIPLVSDLTGLDNYNLSGQSTFNKSTSELIINFQSPCSCVPDCSQWKCI